MNAPPIERELSPKRRQTVRIHVGIIWDFSAPPSPSHATLTLVPQESLSFDLRLKNHKKFKIILAKFQLSMSYSSARINWDKSIFLHFLNFA